MVGEVEDSKSDPPLEAMVPAEITPPTFNCSVPDELVIWPLIRFNVCANTKSAAPVMICSLAWTMVSELASVKSVVLEPNVRALLSRTKRVKLSA